MRWISIIAIFIVAVFALIDALFGLRGGLMAACAIIQPVIWPMIIERRAK